MRRVILLSVWVLAPGLFAGVVGLTTLAALAPDPAAPFAGIAAGYLAGRAACRLWPRLPDHPPGRCRARCLSTHRSES